MVPVMDQTGPVPISKNMPGLYRVSQGCCQVRDVPRFYHVVDNLTQA